MKSKLFWDETDSVVKKVRLMVLYSICVCVCGGADCSLKNSDVPIYPRVQPCHSNCITHVKEQECVCYISWIGSHLLTLEMADLKSDKHLDCVCGWVNSRDREPPERQREHLVSLQGCVCSWKAFCSSAICLLPCLWPKGSLSEIDRFIKQPVGIRIGLSPLLCLLLTWLCGHLHHSVNYAWQMLHLICP